MRQALVLVATAWLLAGCFFFEIDVGDELADAGGTEPGPDAGLPPATCDQPVICPQPPEGKTALCGRVLDTETTQPVLPGTVGFEVTAYIALDFASNPDDPAARITSVQADACGRFILPAVTVPGSQFIAIGTDDVAGGGDHLARTGVMVAGAANGKVEGIRAFATRRSTDQAWSTAAGLASPTLAERGVYLAIFVDTNKPPVAPFAGTPTAGVTVIEDGSPNAANDFYFADTGALTRSLIDGSQTTTGTNGAALFLNGSLVEYSGTGAEPAGCAWATTLGATIPGAVLVKEQGIACN